MSTWPLAPQFTDPESLDAVLLNARVTDKLNELRTLIPDPQFRQLGRVTTRSTATDTDQTIDAYPEGVLFSAGDQIVNPGDGSLQVLVSGYWRWNASVIWDACGSGAVSHRREVFVQKDSGSGFAEPNHNNGKTVVPYPSGAWVITTQTAGGTIALDANDSLILAVYQNTGAGLDVLKVVFGLERTA